MHTSDGKVVRSFKQYADDNDMFYSAIRSCCGIQSGLYGILKSISMNTRQRAGC